MQAGVIEMACNGRYRVRLLRGDLVPADVAPGVDPAFADECMAERTTVIVGDGAGGAVILGALQTRSSATDVHGRVRLSGQDVELHAQRSIALRVGDAALTIDADGAVRLAGKRLTVDVAAVMRVLSAKVELP
jgi:hypothetical protein